jgi:Flp pilus assembly protein TadG
MESRTFLKASNIYWACGGLFSRNHRGIGQAMVEFALVLVAFLLLLLGIIEVGRLAITYVAVTSSSREAARYGAAVGDEGIGTLAKYEDCDGIRAAAKRVTNAFLSLEDSNINIQYDKGPATAVFATCPPNPAEVQLGDRIVVKVNVTFSPILPVGIPSFDIVSETKRTIVRNVVVD